MPDAVDKLRADGAAEATVEAFASQLARLRKGETGLLAESDIVPVDDLPDADELPEGDDSALARAVVIKLNGGLGTSMGMSGPKSLLEVKDGLSFLDITARQLTFLREHTGAPLPLVLMNSFATRAPSMAALDLADTDDFLQSRVPKLLADELEPASWPDDPELEWAPPGHGDLYAALIGSGILERLRTRGLRWAFVSNADNLGAVLDPRILAWVAREEIPFCMEVADRTLADRKGGHLARRPDGGFVLREVAQTPEGDLDAFQDVGRHRFFNTNTLWIDLDAFDGVPELPMIVNRKTVDPKDPSSPAVVQLETAMGAAIDAFDGARGLRVPKRRFAPVKTTNDLLVLRSDAYELTEEAHVVLAGGRTSAPVVDLDPAHFKRVGDFEARFARGAPSLVACEHLTVEGDVRFGAGVTVRGSVTVTDDVPDGAVLEG